METGNFTGRERRDELSARGVTTGYNTNTQHLEEENATLRKQV